MRNWTLQEVLEETIRHYHACLNHLIDGEFVETSLSSDEVFDEINLLFKDLKVLKGE